MKLENLMTPIARVFDVKPDLLRYNFSEFTMFLQEVLVVSSKRLEDQWIEQTYHLLDSFVFEFNLGEPMRLALIATVSAQLGLWLRQSTG